MTAFDDAPERLSTLEATWRRRPGLLGWLSEDTHKAIGIRFIVTALVFFALAGLEAFVMRLQLARPDGHVVGPDLYNQIFTMHGTTMMFLFAVPIMEGMGIYLVPLMVGTRNVPFPRMIAFGYWIFLAGGLFIYATFAVNMGPDAGWFAYVPLSGPEFSPGKRVDVWAQMITFTEISALVMAIEMIVTIFKLRAPGMSLNRMPLYVWSMLVTSVMILFAMPAVMTASGMLASDRAVGTHFFNPVEGGDPLLYQHLFWFFGHPEVYIIFIPALGFVSTIVATFCRRPVFGYTAMVLSLVSTGFIGFGLWVHHMFATGLPQLGESFFTAASMMIAIPSGIQIFCWIATIWSGRPRLATPMLFVLGFIFNFVIGGLTGVMVAAIPFDLQVHDTFFVVAHFHYTLIGGALFPLFGAFYFWFPKMTGRMLSESLGKVNFWLLLVGFNLTFFPMHILGLNGMTRRIYTYSEGMGWGDLNLLATFGAVIIAMSILLFVANVVRSLVSGPVAGDNPWDAATLEWSTTSPPPRFNYLNLPTVRGRYALWTAAADQPVVVGLRDDRRELLATNLMDAEPERREVLPWPNIWPFFFTVASTVGLVGVIFDPWWLVVGAVLVIPTAIGWYWPRKSDPKIELEPVEERKS